ncbi:MAG: rhodanese-like domain-containing protein [Gammaproteobacteria bacterium]|nr:rhodanese-like domain-containing protein [Gammaproteobacteria bacterium]
MTEMNKIMTVVIVVVLIMSMVLFTMFEPDSIENEVSDVDILDSTNIYLASGKNSMITAGALYANLNDGYTGNDPYILDVRSDAAYEAGHIPGAVSIAWRSVFTSENVSLLPMSKQIVVCCVTGHTASQTTAMLNTLGYDAMCLKWGMASWTTNSDVASGYYDRSSIGEFPYVTGADPGTWSGGTRSDGGTRQCGDDPVPSTTGTGDSDSGALADIANNYMASGKPPAISAASLQDNLNDGNTANDPFILSVRSSAQYAIGHIAGAVNIGFKTIFTEENLTKLPDDDRQIVVVCYTGHTASQATALLNMNGFNATALKWGMTGWTSDATIAPSYYNRGTACQNYEVVVGTECGTMADGIVVGKTDSEILKEASKTYLEGGPRYVSAAALEELLSDTDDTNDPFVLSIRSATDYKIGHIPTAVNMPWRSLFSVENLTLLPDDETQVVVVCYTGQTASHITALLNVLGFNATTLLHGMGSWTNNTGISIHFDASAHQMVNPTCSGTAPGDMTTATRQCDDGDAGIGITFEGSSDEWEILRQACEGYIVTVPTMYITNNALFSNLNDGYTANDPYIISARSAAAYAAGHVPTAVHLAAGTLFDDATLATLPTDRQIVVYCFTGQGAGHVSALLNIYGFDSISLKFGMCSWSNDTAITLSKCYNPDTAGNFGLILNSANPGVWEDGVPAN